jgi:hypothetical protein
MFHADLGTSSIICKWQGKCIIARWIYMWTSLKHILQCIGYNADVYNGHSFRIGAATTAASVHMEDHLIKVLGRWSSDTYCRYIRTPDSVLRDAQISMSTVDINRLFATCLVRLCGTGKLSYVYYDLCYVY